MNLQDAFANLGVDWVPRPIQELLVGELVDGGSRLSFLEAPTGIGKSAIALCYGDLIEAKTCVLTTTLSLQNQYVRDFDVALLKGRANYVCSANGLRASEGICQASRDAEACDSEYYDAREACRTAPRIVTNYAMYLTSLLHHSLPWNSQGGPRRLLVCDEGHRLLDQLTEFETLCLDGPLAKRLGFDDAEGWQTIEDAVTWANYNLDSIEEGRYDAIQYGAQDARLWNTLYHQCTALAKLSVEDQEALIPLQTGKYLQACSLWPRRTSRRLFNSAERMLIMSATLYGGSLLSQILGFDEEEEGGGGRFNAAFHSAPSPFPKHRWPVLYSPRGAPNHTNNDWAGIAEAVHEYVHANRAIKGIVHVAAANQVEPVTRQARLCLECSPYLLLPEPGITRADTLAMFRRRRPGTWLVHYSAGEGEDFKDGQCRIQLIAKLPFPDLGDKLTRLRLEDPGLGKKLYAAMTAAKIAQIAGRGMRHEKDWCSTVILDGNFERLWRWHQDLFPEWFRRLL